MFTYYMSLAYGSLTRRWGITVVAILTIAFGVGASMTMLTVLHVLSGDPLPDRSAHLYRPYLDPLPLNYRHTNFDSDPNLALTWPDARALLDSHLPTHQAAMARGYLPAYSNRTDVQPSLVAGSFTTHGFFPMFGVSFVAGRPWSKVADEEADPVVVLTGSLSRRLFGTEMSVGKTVRLGDHSFQVVGVISDWRPEPLFYAVKPGYSASDKFFVPLSTAMSMGLRSNWGNNWGASGMAATSATTSWLNVWVELNDINQVKAYRRFLINYSTEQQKLGRFERPATSARLYGLTDWLHHLHLVPADVVLQTWLAFGFLLVCMFNAASLLMAKFLGRSGEVSVRRALGARRSDIFRQFGIESALIGIAGGLLGTAVAAVGLWGVRHRPDDYAHLAYLDIKTLVATIALAIAVSVLSGMLPAWRASRTIPVVQLNSL